MSELHEGEQMQAVLRSIPINKIKPHPQNPRIVMREDVVDAIAADLAKTGVFSQEYALRVRPVEDFYQIVSGHHRLSAATKAGITEIPCWVREMDDETAFMDLVRSNAQGELSPLEIGLHALAYVELDKRGLGAGGNGLKEYAVSIGKAASSMSEYRNAAQVYRAIISDVRNNEPPLCSPSELLMKTSHLSEIHKSPTVLWPILVRAMLEKGWSVKDTKYYVEKVAEFQVDEKWQHIFLPPDAIVGKYLEKYEFSFSSVKGLIAEAEKIEQRIATYNVDHTAFLAAFHAWLKEGIGAQSWDVRKIIEYGRQLQAELEDAERKASERWLLGDWREHVPTLQDGSVSLVLTDPPYGMDFQSDRRVDRREDRKNDTIQNDGADEAPKETQAALTALYPKLTDDAHIFVFCHWSNEHEVRMAVESAGYKIRGSLIWVKNNRGMGDPKTTFAPRHERIIHAVKGSPILFSRPDDVLFADKCTSDRHPTEKPIELLKPLIEATTTKGELVADPFGGVASTLVAAKATGRKFWGCELTEPYFNIGAERIR